jgi:hypothetical protein
VVRPARGQVPELGDELRRDDDWLALTNPVNSTANSWIVHSVKRLDARQQHSGVDEDAN